jgi:hypothetical protein
MISSGENRRPSRKQAITSPRSVMSIGSAGALYRKSIGRDANQRQLDRLCAPSMGAWSAIENRAEKKRKTPHFTASAAAR